MSDKPNQKSDARFSRKNIIEFPQNRFAARDAVSSSGTPGQVNQRELVSIKALTSYVAHNKNVPEAVVRDYLHTEFRVNDINELRRDDFEHVIKFLVDLRAELLIN